MCSRRLLGLSKTVAGACSTCSPSQHQRQVLLCALSRSESTMYVTKVTNKMSTGWQALQTSAALEPLRKLPAF